MRLIILWSVILLLTVTACASGGGTPTPAPTQALIPATITDTPSPAPPTPLPANLARADQIGIVRLTPPAIAEPLVEGVLAQLSDTLDVDPDTIQVARVDSAIWFGDNLGCDVGEDTSELDNDSGVEGFRVVLAVAGEVYEYHTDLADEIVQCDEAQVSGEVAVDALLAIDPVAAELVLLAQQRLAAELNVPMRRVAVLDVYPVTWQDSSLGCPLSGQRYTRVEVDGYRIVLGAGNDQFAFHTDSGRLTRCALENERLPGVVYEETEEATPEVTAEITAEATPELTSEATAELTAEATPESTVEQTPESTAEVTPESTAEATAEVTEP